MAARGLSRGICPDNDRQMIDAAFDTPGRIKCGTVTVADFAASLSDYTGALGMNVIEEGIVAPALAAAWGAPGHAGARQALLHGGGKPGYLRLVEGEVPPDYAPLTTHGWAAFEITVADVHAVHAQVAGSPWHVLGAPATVGDFASFIPFQVAGRAGEVLFLNQVLSPGVDGIDLPIATVAIDHMFIAVLAAPDRAAAVAFHLGLGFEEGATYSFPYGVINRAFGLPEANAVTLTMTRTARLAASEIDQYPPAATPRATVPGFLPPGCAMVSFITAGLDRGQRFVGGMTTGAGVLYAGRRSACVRGTAGELIELIEAR